MAAPAKTPARPAAPAKQAARPAPAQPAKQAARPAAPAPAQQRPAPQQQARPAGPAAGTQVAPAQTRALTTDDVPDYIRQSQGRGSENVEMQDLVIPRIELAQALSKCVIEGDGQYIDGCKPGDLYNSVTRQLYGRSVVVVPAYFQKQFLNWRDRQKGGGFGGAYDTAAEANENLDTRENRDEWEAVETAQQIVLVVDMDTYETSEAVVSCARTKMKVSRQWNSLIRVNGFDRFSRLYEIFSVDETNSMNQPYKNLAVRYIDFAPQDVFNAAEKLYLSIAEGIRTVKIDDKYEDESIPGEATNVSGGQNGDPGPNEY